MTTGKSQRPESRTITIATLRGIVEVPATVKGGLAVHPAVMTTMGPDASHGYAVTHVRSGLQITASTVERWKDEAAACQVRERLLALADWTLPAEDIVNNQTLRLAVSAILHEMPEELRA